VISRELNTGCRIRAACARLDIKLFLVLQRARLRAELALLTYRQDRLRDHRVAPGEPQASNSIFARPAEIVRVVGDFQSASQPVGRSVFCAQGKGN